MVWCCRLSFLVVLTSLTTTTTTTTTTEKGAADFHSQHELSTIAFGSCNKHDLPQEYWKHIIARKPDLWIWLGDAVYTDIRMVPYIWVASTLENMEAIYTAQKARPEYKAFLDTGTPVIGIWDDHDYGVNDGGKSFKYRLQSQKMFLDFVDEPLGSVRRWREGIYTSYTYGSGDRMVKVVLLDVRSHDVKGSDCDVLGVDQWKWLEEQLSDPSPRFVFIGTGKQVLSDIPFIDKWMTCPASLDKLLFLAQRRAGVIFLSGDVHFSEINCLNSSGTGYPTYEVTSSGLTHSCSTSLLPSQICHWTLKNMVSSRFRVANVVTEKSFGVITIDWNSAPVQIRIELVGDDSRLLSSLNVTGDDLNIRRHPSSCPDGVEQPNWYLKRVFWSSVVLVITIVILVALRITFVISRWIVLEMLKDLDANIKRRIKKLKLLLSSYKKGGRNNIKGEKVE